MRQTLNECVKRIQRSVPLLLFSLLLCCCSTSSIEVAFSPSPDAEQLVERTIDGAGRKVDVAIFYFSSRKIAESLIAAQHRGVQVRVVVDGGRARRPECLVNIRAMQKEGIVVRINNQYLATGARMHVKYMIVDDKTVQTGSFNYSVKSQALNGENVVVVMDNPDLAAKYEKDWQKHWDEAAD